MRLSIHGRIWMLQLWSLQLLKYVLQISLLLMCFEGLGILAVGYWRDSGYQLPLCFIDWRQMYCELQKLGFWSRVSKTRALAGSRWIKNLLCTLDSCLEPVKSRIAIVITHFIYWLNIENPSSISIVHIWQEINAILGDRLSTQDEEAVLAEFEELEMKVLFPYILNYISLS